MTTSLDQECDRLTEIAATVRRTVLDMIYDSHSAHIGAAFSCVDLLVALYCRCLNVDPDQPRAPDRDRFILSKGHACAALYATLHHRGFMDRRTLDGFGVDGGTLEHHPSRNLDMGIEVSTGSLGHGLSLGVGMALAARQDGLPHRVFVVLSDGECDEGSTWEAALFAPQHALDNLVAIVDHNKIQALGRTEDIIDLAPFADKWRAFGWDAREINGHDFKEILPALLEAPFTPGKPSAIIAHTIKGKGVSLMEDDVLWHYRCPDEEEYQRAIQELS